MSPAKNTSPTQGRHPSLLPHSQSPERDVTLSAESCRKLWALKRQRLTARAVLLALLLWAPRLLVETACQPVRRMVLTASGMACPSRCQPEDLSTVLGEEQALFPGTACSLPQGHGSAVPLCSSLPRSLS